MALSWGKRPKRYSALAYSLICKLMRVSIFAILCVLFTFVVLHGVQVSWLNNGHLIGIIGHFQAFTIA